VNSVVGIIVNGGALLIVSIVAMAIALFILERAAPGPRPVMRRGCFAGVRDSASLITQVLSGVGVRMPSGVLSGPAATVCSVSSALMTIVFTALATVALQSAAQFIAVDGFDDLAGKTVVMPRATTAETYVRTNGVGVKLRSTVTLDEAFDLFAGGTGDAMVYDKPILSSFVARDKLTAGSARFAVVGSVFERQQYGIAFDKALSDGTVNAFDKAILAVYGSDEVAKLRQTWLGEDVPSAASDSGSSSITDFLSNNFWSIAFMVGLVIGFAMTVGLIAFTIRTVASMVRRDDCSCGSAYSWVLKACSGSAGGTKKVKRRRQSVVSLHDAVEIARLDRERRSRTCWGRLCMRRAPKAAVTDGAELLEIEGGKAGSPVRGVPVRGADAGTIQEQASFMVDGEERRLATHVPAPSRRRLFGESSKRALSDRIRLASAEDSLNDETSVRGSFEQPDGKNGPSLGGGAIAVRAGFEGTRAGKGFAADDRGRGAWGETSSAVFSSGDVASVKAGTGGAAASHTPVAASVSGASHMRHAASTGGVIAFGGSSFRGGGEPSALLGLAVAAAASEGGAGAHEAAAGSVHGTPAQGSRPTGASEGGPGPAPEAGGPGSGGQLQAGTLSTEERLYLKQEQWAFRITSRLAPVLPPNDLLWLIWERVDKLTQQALLQRAMGRLDVPTDLEEVSPEVIVGEADVLAQELEGRGVAPSVARRAATMAAMIGTTDDDERSMQAALNSDMVRDGLYRAAEVARKHVALLEAEDRAADAAVMASGEAKPPAGSKAGGGAWSPGPRPARRAAPESSFLAATEDAPALHAPVRFRPPSDTASNAWSSSAPKRRG